MKNYLTILFVALLLRLAMLFLFTQLYPDNYTHLESDAREYYYLASNLEPPQYAITIYGTNYSWWERTPVYALYLYLTRLNLFVQLIISSLTVVMLWRINKTAGWLWCFYPQSIILSFQYNKEVLLYFFEALFLMIIYKRYVKNKTIKQILLFCAVMSSIMLLNSYGRIAHWNFYVYKPWGYMQNFWELWKPSFGISNVYWEGWNYIQIIPYILLMFYFLRKIKILSWEFASFITITSAYCMVHGAPRYKEPFMMVLILWFAKQFEIKKEE